ncbi:C-type lectin domain family 17, member A [Sorex fumeus]|uniref:C-type lectin domain family 17, member A n=1 Tax=Sorex fumeus TaxID=62283 RepID=UPI0024AE3455|nr:C-type lectin domain family 17, member A [Sorex fumeus]
MLNPNFRHWDSRGAREKEEDDDYENSAPPYKDLPPKPGTQEVEEDDDYENSAPTYRDLPPKPGTKIAMPPEPWRPAKSVDLKLGPVTWSSPRPGAHLDQPPALPPHPPPPAPWMGPRSKTAGCLRLRRLVMLLSLLLSLSVALGVAALLVAVIQYQELGKELRDLALQQAAWQANVTGPGGLSSLRKDIDRIRASTNQSLMELRTLLERVKCPKDWLPFQGECYYFSPNTMSWDAAQGFCQKHFSHLVIISSLAERNFITQITRIKNTQGHVYWLGLTDRMQEGIWRWLDGSLLTETLSFWDSHEPNDSNSKEDCGSMDRFGRWNDLPCETTIYWICERLCPCS